MKESKSKRKNLEVKRVGSLLVPFSQGRFAQLLMWLQRNTDPNDNECPVDLTILPETPPSPDRLCDGDVFFVFREIQIDKNEDHNEIVFCYDRMRVESGGVEEPFTFISSQENDGEDHLVRDVAALIYEEHKIVFSIDLLKKLRQESSSLRDAKSVQEFVLHLKDRGLFKKATTNLAVTDPVHINEES